MTSFYLAIAFSFLSGLAIAWVAAQCSLGFDTVLTWLIFIIFLISAGGLSIKTAETFNSLVARQQILEQKCIQAGLAVMKTVATEERFEFIETLSVPAEKSEP